MITPSTVKIVADVSGFNRDISSAENKMQSFGGVLGGLKTAAVSLGAAMLASAGVNGLSAMVARSMQLRDAQAKLADRLGITTQSVAALSLQSELSGIGMDGMERALQKMTVRLQDAAAQGGPVADAIKKIGLNVYELASKKPDEAFFMIAAAMKNMTSANEKLNSVSDIFGDKSLAITSMLNEGREGFALAAQKATEFGTAISRVDAAKLEAANDSFTLMKESVDGLATRIGIRLSPMLQQMAENFASNTTAMAKMLGFRTEEEELNHLLASRAGLLKQIADIEASAGGKVQGTAALSARADALRAEINLILNKQRTETEAFVASDKMRIAEEQATAKKLEHDAIEKEIDKGKKARIAQMTVDNKAMHDGRMAAEVLWMEVQAIDDEAEQIIADRTQARIFQGMDDVRQITAVQKEEAEKQVENERWASDQIRNMKMDVFSNAAGLFRALGAENKKYAKIAFAIEKGLALARIAIDTQVAAVSALKIDPTGILSARIELLGAASAILVGATALVENRGAGGGAAGGAVGGGGSAPSPTPYTNPNGVLSGQTQSSGSITINVNGVMTEDIVNNLIVPALQNAVENRDVILIRGDSRNAQQLMA